MFGFLNPWLILGVVLSLVVSFGAGYWQGYSRADQSAVIKELNTSLEFQKAAIEALSRDRDKVQRLADMYKRDADLALADMDTIQRLANDYARELSTRPASASCTFDERDVRWLREIAAGRASLGLAPPPAPGAP